MAERQARHTDQSWSGEHQVGVVALVAASYLEPDKKQGRPSLNITDRKPFLGVAHILISRLPGKLLEPTRHSPRFSADYHTQRWSGLRRTAIAIGNPSLREELFGEEAGELMDLLSAPAARVDSLDVINHALGSHPQTYVEPEMDLAARVITNLMKQTRSLDEVRSDPKVAGDEGFMLYENNIAALAMVLPRLTRINGDEGALARANDFAREHFVPEIVGNLDKYMKERELGLEKMAIILNFGIEAGVLGLYDPDVREIFMDLHKGNTGGENTAQILALLSEDPALSRRVENRVIRKLSQRQAVLIESEKEIIAPKIEKSAEGVFKVFGGEVEARKLVSKVIADLPDLKNLSSSERTGVIVNLLHITNTSLAQIVGIFEKAGRNLVVERAAKDGYFSGRIEIDKTIAVLIKCLGPDKIRLSIAAIKKKADVAEILDNLSRLIEEEFQKRENTQSKGKI